MSTVARKVSTKVAPMLRKISSISVLKVVEPSLDPTVYNVNGLAIAINFLILYGFAAASNILPSLIGVTRRGFFCDDDSIRYEYRKDTVTSVQLLAYNLIMNAFTVLIVEFYRIYKIESNINNRRYRWRNNHIHILFVRLITYFGYSQLGFVILLSINIATKHFVGRLRPHFLDVCKLANNTCLYEDQHQYITNYECTGPTNMVLEARKSFFSGHASISLYCAVWSSIYLQARTLHNLNNRILIPLLQTILIIIGLGISYSRITDNMHHWSDVLVGIFVGSFIAVYNCVFWTEVFKYNSTENETVPLIISQNSQNDSTTNNDNEEEMVLNS